MSGGSFDYAYLDAADFSKAESLLYKIFQMRGYILTEYPDAVPYLNAMAALIEKQRDEYLEQGQKIADLLQSVEWCYSGDTGPDDIHRAISELKTNPVDSELKEA